MEVKGQIVERGGSEWLEQFPAALRQAIERGMARSTELVRQAVAAKAGEPFGFAQDRPFGEGGTAMGELVRSLTTEVRDEKGQTVGMVFLAPPADRYGLFVEVGTRPHFPPPAALLGWVQKRLGITNDRQAREVAFLIARKIARQGTPGRFIFQRALEETEERIVAIFEEELNLTLER